MCLRLMGLCALASGLVLSPTPALGQCPPEVSLTELMSRASVDVIFVGTVANIERRASAETITFVVDWFWKGAVKKHARITRLIPTASVPATAAMLFELKGRYIVGAHHLSETVDLRGSEELFG